MASAYQKGNMIYVSWYDSIEKKKRNRSTGMNYTRDNMKKAKLIAENLQKALDAKTLGMKSIGITHNTIESTIAHFLKVNGGKHKTTIYDYHRFFRLFTQTFPQTESCTIITKLKCEDWLLDLRETNYQQNTLYGFTKLLKKYLRFMFEYNYLPMFILNRDITYKPQVKEIIIFNEEDLSLLLDGLQNKNSNFRTTISLLFYTGLRPSDIFNLKVEDINLHNRTFRYYSQKTQTNFEVPFHPALLPILQARIQEVTTGKLLEYETISNIGKAFRRYLKQIGLTKKGYNLRTFRKSFITFAHSSGLDLATVSKLAGHFQITTTEKYYNKLSLLKKSEELNRIKFPIINSTGGKLKEQTPQYSFN